MLEVIVTFDASAERNPVVVELNNHAKLNARAARAAREVAAPAANVMVSDHEAVYRVTGSGARRVAL